jgi:hypothetical protein
VLETLHWPRFAQKIGQCGFPNTANGFDIGVVINNLLAAKIKGEGVNAVKAF